MSEADENREDLKSQLLAEVPNDGSAIGNAPLLRELGWEADR